MTVAKALKSDVLSIGILPSAGLMGVHLLLYGYYSSEETESSKVSITCVLSALMSETLMKATFFVLRKLKENSPESASTFFCCNSGNI